MKILVVYYSLYGHTKTIAEEISSNLAADIEEIRELTSRKGVKGWLLTAIDSIFRRSVPIGSSMLNPSNYDLVIIGTPVWAFTMSCGVRSWLKKYGKNLKQVAFFATMGKNGDKSTFTAMENLCSKKPLLTTAFIDKTITTKWYQTQLDKFLREIREKITLINMSHG